MPGRTASSGATFIVSSGVTDIGDIVTGPGSLLIVASGGTTISTTIINGGMQEVAGVDCASTVSDGTEVVDSGGIAGGLTVAGSNAQPPGSGEHRRRGDRVQWRRRQRYRGADSPAETIDLTTVTFASAPPWATSATP